MTTRTETGSTAMNDRYDNCMAACDACAHACEACAAMCRAMA
ncbi:hypothetical protein C7S13_8093 [Burkholderia cepacia]|nr:hypothetical protein [Burkholderia cepacia]